MTEPLPPLSSAAATASGSPTTNPDGWWSRSGCVAFLALVGATACCPEHDVAPESGAGAEYPVDSATRVHGSDSTSAPSPTGGSDESVVKVLEGRASYYSDALAGRSTASGEPYDPSQLTAASRDLPFGTRVRVTRLSGAGEAMGSVVVRVNDRGPFGDRSRILDLSRAAAERLDMIRAGVITIRAEVLRSPSDR